MPDDTSGDASIRIIDDDKPFCPWTDDADEQRRAFILDRMADSEIAGEVLVASMQAVFLWLRDGAAPAKPRIKLHKKDDE